MECRANADYEAYRSRGVMKDGRRFGRPPNPYQPPAAPVGKINVTDPDSRNVKTSRGWVQGYNAQAVVTAEQIVIVAEVTVDWPDFGHLEPMVSAAREELEQAGIQESPEVVLADAGYWHQQQMEPIVSDGIAVLVAPDAGKRQGARPGCAGGLYAFMRRVLAQRARRRPLRQAPGHDRAGLRRHQVQPPDRPLPAPRPSCRQVRMAPRHRDPQPPEALAAHHRAPGRLTAATPAPAARTRRSRRRLRPVARPAQTPLAHLSATASARSGSRRRSEARVDNGVMTTLGKHPEALVVMTSGRMPRMLHLPGCSHNSMPQTTTRAATDEERRRLRDCTSCLLRLEHGY